MGILDTMDTITGGYNYEENFESVIWGLKVFVFVMSNYIEKKKRRSGLEPLNQEKES